MSLGVSVENFCLPHCYEHVFGGKTLRHLHFSSPDTYLHMKKKIPSTVWCISYQNMAFYQLGPLCKMYLLKCIYIILEFSVYADTQNMVDCIWTLKLMLYLSVFVCGCMRMKHWNRMPSHLTTCMTLVWPVCGGKKSKEKQHHSWTEFQFNTFSVRQHPPL